MDYRSVGWVRNYSYHQGSIVLLSSPTRQVGELPEDGDDALKLFVDTHTLAPSPSREELRLDRPHYLRDVLEIHVLSFLYAIHTEFPLLNEAFQEPPLSTILGNGKFDQPGVNILPNIKFLAVTR